MKPSQAELLLRIAENTYSDGDEVIAEAQRIYAAHARRIMEDSDLIAKAKEINEADKRRFASYFPRQEQRPELAQGRATSNTLPPPKELMRKAAE